jgi:8-oxo-dGTP pyrophosphatase MutT (NUDIX family)
VNREILITRVARIAAACQPQAWRWAEDSEPEIAAHWAARRERTPELYDGRVLLMSEFAVDGDVARATYFPTDFSKFLAWRDLGYPDPTIGNGFAMGALQGSDGAFVCGVMGQHTANAGRVYFPSGTPDPSDLTADGQVDLAGSVLRELSEETDLPEDSYRVADHWIVVRHWPAIAFLRPIQFFEPAEAVAERIRAAIARQRKPELSDARVVRGERDIDARTMPLFLQSFFRSSYA